MLVEINPCLKNEFALNETEFCNFKLLGISDNSGDK